MNKDDAALYAALGALAAALEERNEDRRRSAIWRAKEKIEEFKRVADQKTTITAQGIK